MASLYALAQRITATKGRKGEKPDFYAATVVTHPTQDRVNGRLVETATVAMFRTNLDGTERVSLEPIDLAFALPMRMAGAEHVALLDGPQGQPYTVREIIQNAAQATAEFLASRPERSDSIDLSDLEVEAVPEA